MVQVIKRAKLRIKSKGQVEVVKYYQIENEYGELLRQDSQGFLYFGSSGPADLVSFATRESAEKVGEILVKEGLVYV